MAIVTEREFKKYVKLQNSGETNMFDIAYVVKETGLSEEKIAYIMQHYAALEEVYGTDKEVRVLDVSEAIREAMEAANAFMAEENIEPSNGDRLVVVFENATFEIAVVDQVLKLNLNLLEPIYVPAMIGLAAGDDNE